MVPTMFTLRTLRLYVARNLMQLVALHLPCKGECNRNLMSATKSSDINIATNQTFILCPTRTFPL